MKQYYLAILGDIHFSDSIGDVAHVYRIHNALLFESIEKLESKCEELVSSGEYAAWICPQTYQGVIEYELPSE